MTKLNLNGPELVAHKYDHDWSRSVCEWCALDPAWVTDARGQPSPHEILSGTDGYLVGPDAEGRYECRGSPEVIRAFLANFVERRGWAVVEVGAGFVYAKPEE
jgi:hypothetical protein